jgi:hypothetical protein
VSSILIQNGWVVTPKGIGLQVIEDGAIVIEGSKIVGVVPDQVPYYSYRMSAILSVEDILRSD